MSLESQEPPVRDLLIVGAGPAGLAAAHAAKQCGLSYLVLERGQIAQTVCDYPPGKPLHSPPQDVELLWGELYAGHRANATREEVLVHYYEFAGRQHRLLVCESQNVLDLERCGDLFRVRSERADYRARNVLLATGGFGLPRRLNAPGEAAERVSYRFVEGRPYAGRQVLVVGGGNSAAEAALWLHEARAKVTLSLRRPSFATRDGVQDAFTGVKSFNSAKLHALAARGDLRIVFRSQVTHVMPDAALLRVEGLEEALRVPCSRIFALVGADPDVSLLRRAGAGIGQDGRPVYDRQTYQTTVPGLYVAGQLTRELHMANAIRMAPRIVRRIAGQQPSERGAGPARDAFACLAKELRASSALVRQLVRDHPRLREIVQSADTANSLRLRDSLVQRLTRKCAGLLRGQRFTLLRVKT